MALWKRQRGIFTISLEKVTKLSNWVVYRHKNKLEEGSDRLESLSLLHPKCARGNKPKFAIPHRSNQQSLALSKLSRVQVNLHARFLGKSARATGTSYPTMINTVKRKR